MDYLVSFNFCAVISFGLTKMNFFHPITFLNTKYKTAINSLASKIQQYELFNEHFFLVNLNNKKLETSVVDCN